MSYSEIHQTCGLPVFNPRGTSDSTHREAPIYLCLDNSGFKASKNKNPCLEIVDLQPEKSEHSGF
jgi:hypothetical protein